MDRMDQNSSRALPPIPGQRLEETLSVAEASCIHQSGHQQRSHMSLPDEPQDHVQQPRIPARVSKKEFQNTVMLLCRDVDAQANSARQFSAVGLQRRNAVRYLGAPPHHQQQLDGNNTSLQTSTVAAIAPAPIASGPLSPEVCKKSSGQSYVEKQRETQQIHTKAHPGDISSLFQPRSSPDSHRVKKTFFNGRGGSDQPDRRRVHIRQMLSRRNKRKAASDNAPQFDPQNGQSLKIQPNWPFGYGTTSSRHRGGGQAQHRPLTQREIRLLLRNPLIRNGNLGLLHTPEGVTPPRPPPHMFGITPGPGNRRLPQIPVPRLPSLKRRNAQRRNPKSAQQRRFDASNDRLNARFRRGGAARDVHVVYSSPVEIARLELAMCDPQRALYCVAEESSEPSDCESTQDEGGEAGTGQEDDVSQYPSQPTQGQGTLSEQKPHDQGDGTRTPPSTEANTAPGPRRFPLVIRGPRPAPTSRSTLSSATSTAPSSVPPTATTQASTPAPGSILEQKPGHLAQYGDGCGMPGCTWAECPRLRGGFCMPVPGAAGESRPEGGERNAAETTGEDDIVSVGNGFSFLRLN